MTAYTIRRVLLLIPTLLLVTMLVFSVVRLIPGSVVEMMVSEMAAFGGSLERELTTDYVKHKLGLDVPIHVQYWSWVVPIFTKGDFGRSLWTDRSITEELRNRIPVSLEIGLMALIIGLVIAIPIGIYSSIRQDTPGDYIARSYAILNISLPTFWLGTMVVVYPSIWLGWSPPVQYMPLVQNPVGNFFQFLLPAFILGMAGSGATMRMTRTMMLEVLRQDYIRTAWAKGLQERTIIIRHALKNALIPVVTMIGMQLPQLVAGSVVMETIFALPGVGLLMIQALNSRDYPVISAVNVIVALFVLSMNLLIDLSYAFLDPRVSYK